jgi:ketosteroid isomerase-like protein
MKYCLFFFLFLITQLCFSQKSNDEAAIRTVLEKQTEEWNKGSIDEFMKGYWNNDSLMFIGKSGVVYGYKNTLSNYKRNYADTARMGKLFFTLVKLQRLSGEYYFVVGKWFLKRSAGDVGGHYTLLLRKIKGRWFIVADHSS